MFGVEPVIFCHVTTKLVKLLATTVGNSLSEPVADPDSILIDCKSVKPDVVNFLKPPFNRDDESG